MEKYAITTTEEYVALLQKAVELRREYDTINDCIESASKEVLPTKGVVEIQCLPYPLKKVLGTFKEAIEYFRSKGVEVYPEVFNEKNTFEIEYSSIRISSWQEEKILSLCGWAYSHSYSSVWGKHEITIRVMVKIDDSVVPTGDRYF